MKRGRAIDGEAGVNVRSGRQPSGYWNYTEN